MENVQVLAPAHDTDVRFDWYQFQNKRLRVSSAGIAISDYIAGMHIYNRKEQHERRLPTPVWAVRDVLLRELTLVYLEKRFHLPAVLLSHDERLERIARTAKRLAEDKRALLVSFLREHTKNPRIQQAEDRSLIRCSNLSSS